MTRLIKIALFVAALIIIVVSVPLPAGIVVLVGIGAGVSSEIERWTNTQSQ